MATTLANLRAALVDKLGLLTIDEFIPDASLNRSINNGIARMATEMRWPWLQDIATISLAAGTQEYPLPARAVTVSVASIGSEALQALSLAELVPYVGSRGFPEGYTIVGNNIRLSSSPNQTGTLALVYTKADNYLVADSDTVLTPDQYADVIVTYAAIDQAIRLRDTQMLNNLRAAAQDWQNSIHDNVLRTSKPAPISIRGEF